MEESKEPRKKKRAKKVKNPKKSDHSSFGEGQPQA